MINIQKQKYTAVLNEQSGIVEQLRSASDAAEVNLAHRDWDSGFGNVVFTRNGELLEYGDFDSPVKAKSYRLKEYRTFATLAERKSDRMFSFFNKAHGWKVDYAFEDECFSITLSGNGEDADQVGLDLNLAMLDLRQNDPVENQFTVKSFSIGRSDEIQYLYSERPGGKGGILLHSATSGAKWRVRYLEYRDHSIVGGLQFIARFGKEFDPAAKTDAVDMTVCVSFHKTLEDALEFMYERNNCPRISAPFYSTQEGGSAGFELSGEKCARLELVTPEGKVIEQDTDCRRLHLDAEGFYRLKAYGASGCCSEAVFHAGRSWTETFRTAVNIIQPSLKYCVESWYWVQAAIMAHAMLGENKRLTPYLYDALINVLGQCIRWDDIKGFPRPREIESKARLDAFNLPQENGFYLYYPVPFRHSYKKQDYSEHHLYKWLRIQDAFGFAQLFLTAYETFGDRQLLDYAVKICDAHLCDHMALSGKLRCFHGEGSESDYTTVIAPAQVVCEIYSTLSKLGDPRSERFAEAAVRIADFLVTRDLEFPTEGCSIHLRWTEDGSIACTALSLLEVYTRVKPDPRYLMQAKKVMEWHDAWCIETSDARSCNSSFRYWETMWEGDAQGRDINCGHAWGLWQGEADFLLGKATGDFKRLIRSYNTYRTNLAKFQPEGTAYATFIPDLMPQRPRSKKLYGSYPEKKYAPLAYYLWPRLKNTWFTHVVAGTGKNGELLVVNGELLDENATDITICPFTPSTPEIINLSSKKCILTDGIR